MQQKETVNPYSRFPHYWQAGWRGILPLPMGSKTPPPDGYTGHRGAEPSYADCQAWHDLGEPRNIALRLPVDCIGLDVDCYDGKPGDITLAQMTVDCGPLPATYLSTSRGDGISGIRVYRVPPGTQLIGSLPGIELIQHHHRYMVVWPSQHPSGSTYQWIDERSGEILTKPPELEELPQLPAAWLTRLTTAHTEPVPQVTEQEALTILTGMPTGERCRHMNAAASHVFREGSRHDNYNRAVLATIAAGRRGCPGCAELIRRMRTLFIAETTQADEGQRTPAEARAEWRRSVLGAVGIIAHLPQGEACIDTPVWIPLDDPVGLHRDVFTATEQLAHIDRAARSRYTSPWAVLAGVLARVTAEVLPQVRLPPIVATRASLNAFYALVGPSGASKTSAASIAEDLLNIPAPLAAVQATGSGEGLINSFLQPDPTAPKRGPVKMVLRDHPHVMVTIDELGQLGSLQSRQGAILAPLLRSAWSGSRLDTINADPTRLRRVPPHSYRLTMLAGVQPVTARILLDDAMAGTPQRWIWMPAEDPHIPEHPPEWPGPLTWRLPDVPRWTAGEYLINIPPIIVDAIRAGHRARHRGQQHELLDGHLTLARLKTAAALAILHGGYDITEQWWEIAGHISNLSVQIREQCVAAIARDQLEQAKARGRADHARAGGQEAARLEQLTADARRLVEHIRRHADSQAVAGRKHEPGEGCTLRCVSQRLGRRTPEQRAQAVAHAVDMDWIRVDDQGRMTPGTPPG